MENTTKNSSFGKAFKAARLAGSKRFTWNNKQYTTDIKGDNKSQPTKNNQPANTNTKKPNSTPSKENFMDRMNKIAGKSEFKPVLGKNSQGQFTAERQNAMGVKTPIPYNGRPQATISQGGRTAAPVQEYRNKEGQAQEWAKKDREAQRTTERAIPIVAGALLWPEATVGSIIGGYGVDKGSQALTGKTWGQNVANATGVSETIGDFTNPGIWAGGFAGSRLAVNAARNAAVKDGATLLEGKYYKPSGSVPTTTKLTTQSRLTNPNITKGGAKAAESKLNNTGSVAQKSVTVTEGPQQFNTRNWSVGGRGSKGSVSGGTQGAGRQGAARITNAGAGNQKGLGFGNQSTSTRDLIANTSYQGQAPNWTEVPTDRFWLPSHIQLPGQEPEQKLNLPVGGPLPRFEQSIVAGQPISIEKDFGEGIRKNGYRIGKYTGKTYIDSIAPNVSPDVRNRPAAYEKQVAPLINRAGTNPVISDSSQISLTPVKNEIRDRVARGALSGNTSIVMPGFNIQHK